MRYSTIRPLILPAACASVGAVCLWIGWRGFGWGLIGGGVVMLVVGL